MRKQRVLLPNLVIVAVCGFVSGQVSAIRPTEIRDSAALHGQSKIPFPTSSELRSKANIQLVRQGCLGPCPQYTVTVYGDGKVIYEGREAVRVKGRARGKLSRTAVDDLLDKINGMDFFAYQPHLGDACVVDGPSARITLSEPGRQRTIEDNCLLGNEIDELEAAVDAAVHIQQWVFIDEGELQTQIDQGWEVTVHGEEYAQQALGWDDPGVLRVLIENGLALDSRDRDGQTLLMRAIEANRMKSVRELLEMGADPKALDHQGLAPAPHAGFKGVEVCKLFFKHGVGVNYQDAYGQTMLISAATNRDLETLKFLIESGANPNFRRRDGYSAIGMAKRERDQYQSLVDATFRPDYFGNREIERALYTDLVRKCDAVIEYLKEHGGKE